MGAFGGPENCDSNDFGGQGCQDSLYLHFGLGDATSIGQISADFPGGKTVVYMGPFAADQRVWLFEDGTTATGWAPP